MPSPSLTAPHPAAALVRSEWSLVALGAAAVALHVADDTLLQPNPGTSPADHLVSGLVPIALVAGAAALFGGLPPAGAE